MSTIALLVNSAEFSGASSQAPRFCHQSSSFLSPQATPHQVMHFMTSLRAENDFPFLHLSCQIQQVIAELPDASRAVLPDQDSPLLSSTTPCPPPVLCHQRRMPPPPNGSLGRMTCPCVGISNKTSHRGRQCYLI